ncbi:MAG TPA: MFS transporter [Isosphaeraceae bacterium]|jgi:MFS family permease|nr:MFS transporter [Isosphaeraceae bacterium]
MHTPTPSPDTETVPSKPVRFGTPVGGAYFALTVLFVMNLLNYVDRYVFFQLGPDIQKALSLNDKGFGILSSAFMVVYTIVSPFMGWLGDRYNRRRLLALGVGIWSLATVGTSFAQDFNQMFFWRAVLGIGEASYGVIAPPLLADLFSPKYRGRVMGVFYLALPLGGALGYGIGGWVGVHWGWRAAFWVVGLPGLLTALAGLMINDPGRGASEGRAPAGKADRPQFREYLELFRTPSFLYNIAGMAAVTFAIGAYAAWGATFYQRVRMMPPKQAGLWIGGLTAVSGLLGITLGTWIADFLLKFTRRAYLLWAGIAVMAAIPFGLLGILHPSLNMSLGMMFVAMILMASTLGPCNTVTANVVPATQRAAGYALGILLIHLFGDISSPILIGAISDRFGRPTIADSPLGHLLASIGATPVAMPTGTTNLTAGMLSVIPMLALGSFFFWVGSRYLAADQERAQHLGSGTEDDAPLVH